MESLLRTRAADLGLSDTDLAEWDGAIDDELVAALLSGLVAYEDALAELSL